MTPTTQADNRVSDGRLFVGVADAAVSADPKLTIETDALGSSIGVALFDPVAHVGGILHFMLPSSAISDGKADRSPAMFADTGVPMLIERVRALGATSENLIACAAGGAEMLNDDGEDALATRNRSMLKDLLLKNDISLAAEDIGGTACRTLSLSIADGEATIRNNGKERVLWPA